MTNLWRSSAIVAALVALAVSGCGPADSATPAHPNPSRAGSSPSAIERKPAAAASHGSAYDLSADEALGGHTLQRHVGKSDTELIERLAREPQISSASTYTDRATAESVVAAALHTDNRAFVAWRERTGRRPNFVLRYHANREIGRSISRGRSTSVSCDRALIVLRWDDRRERYYVLTSYPEAGR